MMNVLTFIIMQIMETMISKFQGVLQLVRFISRLYSVSIIEMDKQFWGLYLIIVTYVFHNYFAWTNTQYHCVFRK